MIYIDYKAAYDSIDQREPYRAMKELEIPTKLIRLVMCSMVGTSCRAKNSGDCGEEFEVGNKLRWEII